MTVETLAAFPRDRDVADFGYVSCFGYVMKGARVLFCSFITTLVLVCPPHGFGSIVPTRRDASRRLRLMTHAPPTLPSVPRAQVVFGGTHRGRDITTRMSRQWRGLSLDENDDRGRPPYRTPRAMDDDAEEEFVWQWCDHYLGKAGLDGVVAYLSEYAEQAEREEAAEDGGA